ncbi:MAG: N-acetylmuramic acid 6-phosphate etherase [Rhodospirillaceae bacterium]|nr:N-acetylmuramic acid 6-phosphate etherase [Rhodospirillaceae bacterium]|tara:strand:- start:550 stop:1449 length:900 start_codon:yes stop_codon:yes gene_type:complete
MRKTEEFATTFDDLETRSDMDIATAILDAQDHGLAAARSAIPVLTVAAQAAAAQLREHPNGRIVYGGAGTSIRLGVQDGVELAPTFGWPNSRLAYLIAGGPDALIRTAEGAEDNSRQALRDAAAIGIGPADVCITLSASGVTPYTLATCGAARNAGAITIGIANNPDAPLLTAAEYPILLDSGPEPIGGSTRMTAGTTQKVALNLLSSLVMIRLGRVYRGMMVDVIASNEKLRERAVRIVMASADVDEDAARSALATCGNAAKPAVLVARGLPSDAADQLLDAHAGDLRAALATLGEDG